MVKNEKVKPILITTEKGETYTLEFSRESVKFAEQRGFDISELTKYPQTNIPALWFYAFRMNHRNLSRGQTDKILADLGGLKPAEIERLVLLYNQPTESLIVLEDDERKNAKVTLEM